MTEPDPAELVLRDLIDALFQENVGGIAGIARFSTAAPEADARLGADAGLGVGAGLGAGLGVGAGLGPDGPGLDAGLGAGERWCRVDLARGWLMWRCRDGGALQPHRFARAPVWFGGVGGRPRVLTPSELLTALVSRGGPPPPHAAQVAADLRGAVAHTAVTLAASARLPDRTPRPGGLLAGERLAATRNRPFHPTARVVAGWSAAELERYGPTRHQPLGMDWLAVRRDLLGHGSGAASGRLEQCLLDDAGQAALAAAARRANLSLEQYQPVPVHPWQFTHVLPGAFAGAIRDRDLVPLARGLGRFHPTSSLRTLTTSPETGRHLKLPLGAAQPGGRTVATLGSARLIPPRYLDNAERAQHLMRRLLDRDPRLRARVDLCDERTWCVWCPDPDAALTDPPGQLAAQVRDYPAGLFADPQALVLPMAALAAHEWEVLLPALAGAGFDPDPVRLFRTLAEPFCELAFGFLRYGVLPELHGQNVVVVLARGSVRQFVLRDHDTLRLYPEWMRAQRVPDPGYRIRPGAAQSLRLASPQALIGYLQSLGFQVNLYGIADALARHHRLDERLLWSQLRAAIAACLDRLDLPAPVAEVAGRELLRATHWPSRQVLGPLLRQGRSTSVSMPAATGRVPNPLSPAPAVVT